MWVLFGPQIDGDGMHRKNESILFRNEKLMGREPGAPQVGYGCDARA